LSEAEEIKRLHGCPRQFESGEFIEIQNWNNGGDHRRISKQNLSTILQARMEEILLLIRRELAKEGVDESLPTGVVLTGGSSQLKGLLPLAQQIFPLPVRLGRALRLGGLSEMISNPSYAVLVGLVQLGFEESEDLNAVASYYQQKGLKKVKTQMSKWIQDFF
jgi:cell division protein FtsA